MLRLYLMIHRISQHQPQYPYENRSIKPQHLYLIPQLGHVHCPCNLSMLSNQHLPSNYE
uniref:Allantoate deiminase isoform X2 n=1 Tax=Rhizophora mucronata TaxID=61149 RepID=A0A2P2L3L2_RHIMU